MSDKIPHLLIVDDELSMRELLEYMMVRQGYRVLSAGRGRDAVSMIQKNSFDLILCDIRLGDISGLDVLRAAKKHNSDTVVIMISAYASAETAVEAMNEGAYDYLPKPFDNNELRQTIKKALELKTVEQEKKNIDDNLKKNLHFGHIVGNSSKMQHIYEMILQVAKTRTNILISGESGTGKELIARAIHEQSGRKDEPFVAVNCGGIPETLIESELFGHKKGSFTGASSDKKGLFQTADKGTVFLDEIGEVSHHIQVKLLRAVQEKVFKPVGSNEDIAVDVRIICATNRNLEKEVIEGRFREDLFYRLNVIEIKVPPLRERKEDLRILAQHFLDKYSREANKEITKISSYAIDLLNKYDFPGNIRELENLIERSVALSMTNIILPDSLAISVYKKKHTHTQNIQPDIENIANGVDLDAVLEDIERAYILKALELTSGKKNRTAKLLKINTRSLRYRMDKLGIGN
ncbi:Two component system response regulator, sigma54-specific [Desulfonema limicola]|uniref:Two component system response regulator, sigma54-specific n=1 Tax=Desulfonema limicola TaxID=45656 RepID=A0A975GHX3_9BACT|nr:sigma-54 dependent transcriptional regulator [Desulfonema limicola]QTA81912.1 Two component system response regulator, sigma54-specific [Desulfonema limicola]